MRISSWSTVVDDDMAVRVKPVPSSSGCAGEDVAECAERNFGVVRIFRFIFLLLGVTLVVALAGRIVGRDAHPYLLRTPPPGLPCGFVFLGQASDSGRILCIYDTECRRDLVSPSPPRAL